MRITTTRFGRIDVDDEDLLTFPSGLPGLEDCRRWALLADAATDSLGWLQSTTRADVALAVVSPRRFIPDYQLRIPRSELAPLRLEEIGDAQILLVVGHGGNGLSLNLKAPIIVNIEARTGRQVVASGDLPVRYELVSDLPHLRKSA